MGRLAGLILVLVVVGFVVAVPITDAVEPPGELEARVWMQLDKTTRVAYVSGFLAGMTEVVRYFGADIRSGIGRSVTVDELSDQVYLSLLRQPELRAGPIAAIIVTAIAPYLSITDRSGVPLPAQR